MLGIQEMTVFSYFRNKRLVSGLFLRTYKFLQFVLYRQIVNC